MHSSPVADWAPTHPGSSYFSVLFFCLLPFLSLLLEFSGQELKWSAIPFSSGPHVVRILHPSWVALHSMAHGFTELDKAVVYDQFD